MTERDGHISFSSSSARTGRRSNAVGVIGLGIMGGAIARNLLRAGFEVIGFDPDPKRNAEAQEASVEVVKSAALVAAAAERVLTCLPHSDALDETTQAIASLPEPNRQVRVVAELSTLSMDSKVGNRDVLADIGISLLDCPLSGTGAQAEVGDLVVYASGDAAAFARCQEIFSGFARTTRYLGDFGRGTKMKLVANLLVAIHNVAAAEAILLGVASGLDANTLCDVLGSGAGGSRMFDMRAPLMVQEKFEPATMKLDVWKKDMALIRELAESCGVVTPVFSATAPLYDAAIAVGRGQEDTAAVYRVLKELSARRQKGES